MAHAVAEEPHVHMGMPLSNGKLALWLFLVTEIMFFTGLIGTYMILRHGTPTLQEPWPAPHDVHLIEWVGAFNTFVLICSSLTVVLAHHALSHGHSARASQFVLITLLLGVVFLVVKAFEYNSKIQHQILPGQVYEKLEGPYGPKYLRHVKEQLEELVKDPVHAGAPADKVTEVKGKAEELLKELPDLTPQQVSDRIRKVDRGKEGHEHSITGLLKDYPDLHLSYAIPFGNLWSSCYFAMTGFHALHVFGGLVIFVVILLIGLRGGLQERHESMLELTGLYWHFVDIVWIFLFPLLYLV